MSKGRRCDRRLGNPWDEGQSEDPNILIYGEKDCYQLPEIKTGGWNIPPGSRLSQDNEADLPSSSYSPCCCSSVHQHLAKNSHLKLVGIMLDERKDRDPVNSQSKNRTLFRSCRLRRWDWSPRWSFLSWTRRLGKIHREKPGWESPQFLSEAQSSHFWYKVYWDWWDPENDGTQDWSPSGVWKNSLQTSAENGMYVP